MGFQEGSDLFPSDNDGNVIHINVDYLETWRAMEDAFVSGKIRSIGLSNFNIQQMERVLKNCQIRPAVIQIEVQPYLPENKLREYCRNNGIVVTAYASLLNGVRGSKGTEEFHLDLFKENVLVDIAKAHNKTVAQVALRWAIQNGMVVIPRSTNAHRLKENFEIFDFELSLHEMASVGELNRNFRAVTWASEKAHPHYPFRHKE